MMESVRHRSQALPSGVAASALLHVLVAAYIVFWITKPPVVEQRPVDLSKAIPILMNAPIKPEPPKPESPKPPPKEPPKPMPTPEVIETTSATQAVETAAEKIEPPPEPPSEPQQPPQQLSAPYDSFVRGMIEKEKGYPREARIAGEEGTAMLWFVINRYGTVLGFDIRKRTGSASLDQAIRRMMKRIKFPPLPDDERRGQDRIEYTIPVGFRLED